MYWTPWTFLRLVAANHILVKDLVLGAAPVRTLLTRFTSARLVVPLSSVPIRLELPPSQLSESALLIYRECFHSYLRKTRDSLSPRTGVLLLHCAPCAVGSPAFTAGIIFGGEYDKSTALRPLFR
ncbi:uncharacterized protein M421DRAFT_145007 [Didymella exigua CBS 183.55]|uniref:Uncharacterized protein n=1 Tax=Didymella exigua CBS 183.55 TaxID=1150837 RepID=A0A6A5RMM1_9PLEO|nr:uncharacterized protein M421DRAFT_145007 [Didymella exigua CBS 183.55]KAF1929032.1 hypothetical protein M421DRAFT_145007 [Didymella exigua CBS 183.55]